jgi:hypothetical protein
MQFHCATITRIITRWAVLTACLVTTLLGETAFAAASVDAADADVAAEPATDASAAKPFDPAAMPEVGPAKSPLGYHYAELTSSQTSVLRRGFKLPLDALASAKSPTDLKQAIVLAPLPDPSRPLLAVSPAAESQANPFADSEAISFRKDPLKALGALLGASGARSAGSTGPATAAEEDDPFGSATVAPAATPAAEVESGDDPFGADADPFGADAATEAGDGTSEATADEEDPFGSF